MHDASQTIGLMIIGAEKAATTSLLEYLGQHPSLLAHRQREMGFFLRDGEWQAGWTNAQRRYFSGADSDKTLIGKNVGILYSTNAVSRVKHFNPEMVVVISVRDPVQRAYSSYLMARRKGLEPSPHFEQAIGLDVSTGSLAPDGGQYAIYVERGLYSKYLRFVTSVFPPAQVRVLSFDDILTDPAAVCQALFALLEGVDPGFVPDTSVAANPMARPRSRSLARLLSSRGRLRVAKRLLRKVLPDQTVDRMRDRLRRMNEVPGDSQEIPEQVEQRLRDFYRPFNHELAKMTGLDLSLWDEGR